MDTAVLKLRQLISARYGKGLEIRPMMDLSKVPDSSGSVISGNDLFIPIVVQEQFLGAAVIPHGWELSEETRKKVAQLVRMVLEPKLHNEFLARRESNLKCLQGLEFPETNLTLFGESGFDIIEEAETEGLLDDSSSTTSLIHLYGQQISMIKKVALQIHEFSGRWAFVPFEDIQKDVHSATDLSNLGGMTIFVENVESLSPEKQDILAEYLSLPRTLEEPLILTSSTMALEELEKHISSPGLMQDMLSTHLEVERAPLNSATLREVIEMIFQKNEAQDLH
jgi:hypothetical protein